MTLLLNKNINLLFLTVQLLILKKLNTNCKKILLD